MSGRFDFVRDHMFRMCLEDAYDAVEDMNLWDYLKQNTFESFTYYHDRPDYELHATLMSKVDRRNVHSGASYGIAMRIMESIAKHGMERWKTEYIRKGEMN